MKKILILTQPNDLHACVVAEALARRGAQAVLWHTSDYPTRSRESVLFENGVRRVRIEAPETAIVDDGSYHVVWHRRPTLQVIDPAAISPADREFVELGCMTFRRGLFDGLGRDAFWVNDYTSSLRAESKLRQQSAAMEVGLTTPDTLFSNDPDEVRGFLRRHGGTIVYKPLNTLAWKDEHAVWVNYTSLLTEEELVEEELLQAVPGIFQSLVPKAFELRLTMIGRHALTAKLLSQRTEKGRLDWRRSYDELTMEPFAAAPALIERCRALLDRLGLVFGCFDFVVTPDGRFVFLEVNQMGQFLFVERYAGLPMLDCFTEMLLAGTPDFAWREHAGSLRYADLAAPATRRLERDRELHVERKPRDQDEATLSAETVPQCQHRSSATGASSVLA